MRTAVADSAAHQSRRVIAAANAELCNRAVGSFLAQLYDETADGVLCNLAVGGRIIIATPWSRTQHAAYGLTDHGARVLRAVIAEQLQRLPFSRTLLWLERGRWHLNLRYYGSLAAAQTWLHEWPVTADAWLRHNDALPRRGRKTGRT